MSTAPVGVQPCDWLLPAASVDPEAWACVACDQYTSQPEYWQEVAAIVGEKPSCLHMIVPECSLADALVRVPCIQGEMAKYITEGTLLQRVTDGFILVERTTESGQRLGLVCAADLEQYDFTGKKCLIRPTEETITARLPARLTIRRHAPIELSHVMLLMDDPLHAVLRPLYARCRRLMSLYDFPLMQHGGRLRGWAITQEEDKTAILDALAALKARLGPEPLLFAVGDGNHSLAAAKAHWEEIKAALSLEEQSNHPARYAMVEVVNLHDDALQFEPIHRIVTGADVPALIADWIRCCREHGLVLCGEGQPEQGEQPITLIHAEGELTAFAAPDGPLPVAMVQSFLDDFLVRQPEAEIDYIHGDDVLRQLSGASDAAGFLLPPMEKSSFFDAVQTLGILPRKTFSMGHAHEKRFYMECRRIV